jgi:phosphate starvation-inducible protein PhoH and related proteins
MRKERKKSPRKDVTFYEQSGDYEFKPRSRCQRDFYDAIYKNTITIASGPAGTGKTFVSAAVAVQMLQSGEIDRVIITRPAVEAGEELGFLPGDVNEKYYPYIAPFVECVREIAGNGFADYLLKSGKIQPEPLAYMRGKTFRRALAILDEAQNTTPSQVKLFLTRLGEGSRIIIDGDVRQKDIAGESGLESAIHRLERIEQVKVVRLSQIVRHGLINKILAAYEN